MTTLYKVIGLHVATKYNDSYDTENPYTNRISHDDAGKGISKRREFTTYTVYISTTLNPVTRVTLLSDNEPMYYAIHLSESNCASFGGKLCTIGNMNVTSLKYTEIMTNITHVPLNPIYITGFDLNASYEDDVVARLYDNDAPDTVVFKYSNYGNDERTPSGYVYVNTRLFMPKHFCG
jgi:hypothetical protein